MKSLLKKLLPKSLITRVKSLRAKVARAKLTFFGKTPWLTHVYYSFFSSEFKNEHYSVYKGREAYFSGVEDCVQALVLLRRNIHRLEKGLIMRPRRDVFAENYLEETVVAYAACVNNNIGENGEIKWADDVLKNYFDVVNSEKSAIIAKAKSLYQSTSFVQKQANCKAPDDYVPYRYAELPATEISTQSLDVLFHRRRSIRWYEQKDVPLASLEQAIAHASLAPSACNRQPYKFHAVLDQDKATTMADIAMGTKGFSSNIPAMLAVVGDLSAYPFERDRHVIYIDGALASMQLMLSLDTLGLASCPINWPDMPEKDKKISEFLNLKPYEKVIMLIAVGYADPEGLIPFSQKKSTDSLLKIVG